MLFEVLGPTVAWDDDARIEIASPMQRALLVALLTRPNQAVPLADLEQVLWEPEAPASARASLHNQMLRLRRALGPRLGERLRTVPPGYLVEVRPAELDEQEFLHRVGRGRAALHRGDWAAAALGFDAALGLWRGDPGSGLPDTAPLAARTRRLAELRLQALEGRIEAGLGQGRHRELLAEIQALADQHPVVEPFHSALMLALYRCDRQAEALAAFRRLRTVLAEELGVEPSAKVQDLHRRLLNADASLTVPIVTTVPTAMDRDGRGGRDRAPRQLPADTAAFTGRTDELDRLIDIAQEADTHESTVVISAIDGMAGIGKTALAVHAAHRLAKAYPDGQLFLDLHGYTQGRPPRTASEAASWLLRALGVPPEQIPHDGEQAAALYRQRLAGTRTLIVLDNAAAEAQVRPLLPGGGSCLVLVTSRRRLKALDDAHAVSLDLLPPPDAVALLRAAAGPGRIPPDDPLSSQIAELCDHLPLALRIAGALLRHRPTWTLEHLAAVLRVQRERVPALSDGERDLAAVFDLSYASLDERHRRLWRRLGLVPGPDLDAYAAAALMNLDPAAAEGLLQNLVDHNLLIEYRPSRYRLHDLMRAHARALAAADAAADREAVLDRLLHYYAHTAQSASVPVARYRRPVPEGPAPGYAPALSDPEAARTWLRTEHLNLDAAQAHARAQDLGEHTIALAAGLAEILQTDGPWTRALEIHHTAAETAERLGRPAARAIALIDLGRVRNLTGDYAGGVDAHTRALEAFRTLGDRHGEADALTDLGRLRLATASCPEAGGDLTRALEIYRGLGDRRGEANALTNLGWLRCLAGDYPTAVDALTCALEIHLELGNRLGQANALTLLGRVRRVTEDHRGAGDALACALEIYRELGNRIGQANALKNLGSVRLATGDFRGAGEDHTRAIEIFRELGDRHGEAAALTYLGSVRLAAGDHRAAGEDHARALEMFRGLGDRGNEAWALNHYAATLAATGRRPQALALYRLALAMNRELNKPDDEAVALEGLAEHHLSDGDADAAATHLRDALAIFQRLGTASAARRIQGRLDDLAGR